MRKARNDCTDVSVLTVRNAYRDKQRQRPTLTGSFKSLNSFKQTNLHAEVTNFGSTAPYLYITYDVLLPINKWKHNAGDSAIQRFLTLYSNFD